MITKFLDPILDSKPFEYVTIIEEKDTLGHLQCCFDGSRLIELIQGESEELLENHEIDKLVEEEIIIYLSGYTSELKFGVDNPDGAHMDVDSCFDLALSHCGDGDSASELLDICLSKSKYLVNENWDKIKALAHKLLEKNTLLESEVIDLL